MAKNSYYLIEVYLPKILVRRGLLEELREPWSRTFGGLTVLEAEGTSMGEGAEKVVILRMYVPSTFNRRETMKYFRLRRIELERRFPDQDSILITFSEGHQFL